MIKYFLAFLIALSFSACSLTTLTPSDSQVQANKKAFEEEDTYIMFALRAEQIGDYRLASEIFNTLYEESNKKEYMYRSLQNDLSAKDFRKVIVKTDAVIADGESDFLIQRIKIVALIGLYKYDEAEVLAVDLVKNSQEINDYLLVTDIYVQLKNYETAVKYLEGAYVKDYNEKILDKMTIILYINLHRTKEAIAQLETHIRVHGCSQLICSRLIGFYSNENDIEGILYTYLKLYEINKSHEVSQKIIQIYAYKKDYISMMSFLESSKSDDKALLQLYVDTRKYTKASLLSENLYKESGDYNYLAQSAIYKYESSEDKNNKEMLDSVISTLKDVLGVEPTTLYFNYLGYIMIEHEVDVKVGMFYVQKALKLEPNSAFYLDSLAWGYYKLGDCKEAKRIIDRVVTLEGGDDEEVISHVKSIDECLKK